MSLVARCLRGIRAKSMICFSVVFCVFGLTASTKSVPNAVGNNSVIAEGTYVTGSEGTSETMREDWVLSELADHRFRVEGRATQNQPEVEILNYRMELDAGLHPSRVELHTVMDYPSYTCELGTTNVQCAISFEEPNPQTSGRQNIRMKRPYDLFGFHSYGWIIASIVGRLRPGQTQETVRLFLPNEDRYPDATAEVRRESPESLTIAGKTFHAQKFTLKLVMDSTDQSSAAVWTSKSGICLKVQAVPGSGANMPIVELTRYKQGDELVPKFE
jgi:hypothetical protein